MKKSVVFVIAIIVVVIVIFGIFFVKNLEKEKIVGEESGKLEIFEKGLGNLCDNEEGCISFCQNNRRRCEEYCKRNKNELCVILFPSESLPSCNEKKELFTVSPVSFEDLNVVIPLGSLNPSSHVFPTDHIYMNVKRDEILDMPKSAMVVSPGEIYIIQISSYEHISANSSFTDYDLEFYPCKEIYAKFGHVTSISKKLQEKFDQSYGECNSYSTGATYVKRCNKRVNVKLEAGDEIGTTGGFKGAAAGLDFWLADYRKEKINYANPSRWGKISFYITCPIDYFIPDIRNKMYLLLNRARSIEPICGTIEQDIAGTAQGVWFVKGTTNIYPEDLHLALAHDNIRPLNEVFSVGMSLLDYGLSSGTYHFSPKHSGMVNRDFKEVLPDGTIYCYDSLSGKFGDQISKRIILQLTSPTTLKIQGQAMSSCDTEPWSFEKGAEFER